jgi:hypothetical protein
MTTIGVRNLHLDLGTQENQSATDYYGIPYNVVNGSTLTWSTFAFDTAEDYSDESDCATGSSHTLVSPCTSSSVAMPQMPIPTSPLVESGITTAFDGADHHLLVVDSANCRLWEAYNSYRPSSGVWHFNGVATWDLNSTALRPDTWTSSDAAGFPVVPLLLRSDEASAGAIRHALRFTLPSGQIRRNYVWPARHGTGSATSTNAPQMGQLFRLKSTYMIPSTFSVQSRAILQAMKTYGVYLSDIGSSMYIQGIPSANWSSTTISQVQSVSSAEFEAVDLTPITSRSGFDPNSAAASP